VSGKKRKGEEGSRERVGEERGKEKGGDDKSTRKGEEGSTIAGVSREGVGTARAQGARALTKVRITRKEERGGLGYGGSGPSTRKKLDDLI